MKTKNLFYIILIAAVAFSCRRSYTPPEVTIDHNILVVEGFINTGADSSFFKLSRTQKLGSTSTVKAEIGAQLFILSASGTVIATSVNKSKGEYSLYSGSLNVTDAYRLKIITTDNKEYQSDLLTTKQTPAIDSLTWKYDTDKNGIQFYINTHDATKNATYYKWNCEETWEYKAYFESLYKFVKDTIIELRTPAEQVYRCWSSEKNSSIFINTTERLAEDIITNEKILFVPKGSNRFNQRYSLLVKQYALTKEAYDYWLQLKQMTELGGSVFDVQPTQLIGNLHCVTNADEPVIGYISAATTAEKRIFIDRNDAPLMVMYYPFQCEMVVVPKVKSTMATYYVTRRYLPIAQDVDGAYLAGSYECSDCRYFGGVTQKPAFW